MVLTAARRVPGPAITCATGIDWLIFIVTYLS